MKDNKNVKENKKVERVERIKRKKKFGDRKDGYRVSDITGLTQIMLDIKPNRSVSDVYINQNMDVTKLCEYVEKKKKNGEKVTFFHAFVTAIGKLLYNRNKLNRFIANRHVYEHYDVIISFVAKVAFEDASEEMMIMVPVDEDDNINTISKKIKDKVENIRSSKKLEKAGANNIVDVLAKFPNFLRVPMVGLLKHWDRVGRLPKSICDDNLYYSSMIVSNLGAIGCGAIFHNITDFGACSSLATMGEIKTVVDFDEKGNKRERKLCEFGINMDERVADGYYFAKSLKMIQYIFDNPELLEGNASDKIDMGELK